METIGTKCMDLRLSDNRGFPFSIRLLFLGTSTASSPVDSSTALSILQAKETFQGPTKSTAPRVHASQLCMLRP